jgi:hypothetical protein
MSLTLSSFRYLAWVGTRLQLQGPVLVLGRQMVFGSSVDVAWALRTQGRQPLSESSTCGGPNIRGLDLNTYGRFTNDVVAMRMLVGDASVTAVDIDSYQGAELIHDISKPFPEANLGRYGLIVDAGTLEHVLDVKASLDNLVACLREGGSIVHMSPSNDYLDHGYFQFCPSFFRDYYASQAMSIDNVTLVEQPARRTNHAQWTFWHWNEAIKRKKMMSDNPLATFCAATKPSGMRSTTQPRQDFADYLRRASDSRQFELRPWGLRPVIALAPAADYPLT